MRRFLILLFFVGITLHSKCQIVCGGTINNIDKDIRTPQYIANGGVFTPKGDIRVLVIFVTYGGVYDTMHVDGWSANADRPQWALSNTPSFYCSYTDFNTNIYSGENRYNVSDFYYQMSNGSFRMIVDYYPSTIHLNPNVATGIGDFHKKILAQIPPSFDWTPYDNRKNHPNFFYDNSFSSPDSIIDYVVFCHRFNNTWRNKPANWTTAAQQ